MFLSRRTHFVLTTAIVTSLALGVGCHAATKSKAKVQVRPVSSSTGLTKISVPSSMLQGSLLTSGRAFYKSSIPENTLAGIRLGRPANTILAKWGNPSRITLGTARAEVADISNPLSMMGGPAYVGPEGMMSPSPAPSPYGAPAMPGLTPGLPGLGGLDMPGAPGQTTKQPTKMLSQEEVTWTYDLHNGITLEFIITDGTITQITVGGEGPWSLSKTRTGIQLGDSYKLVLWVSGFPTEPQKYVGRFLRVSYVEKNRALYTFLNKKVVGVTIAMVDSELE